MSSAPTQARVQKAIPPRMLARYRLNVPVDVTVLVSGVPQSVPGRSLDVCEGGLAAVLAADLQPGDVIGVQFRLPDLGLALNAKAVVRHQAALRYGMEFMALSPAHKAMIRYWASRLEQGLPAMPKGLAPHSPQQAAPLPAKSPDAAKPHRGKILRSALWAALAASLIIAGLGWWQWYRVWSELESRVPAKAQGSDIPRVRVPAGVMQSFLLHKVDPVYPEAAEQRGVQGIVVLRVVISPDGTVHELHAASGPPELTAAALDAVKWWRFQPYKVNGQPVEVDTTIAVEFRPQT